MVAAFEELAEAINLVLAVDPDTLTDEELNEAAMRLQRQRARLGTAAARLLGRWDRRRIWAMDQSLSAPARLARETRCSLSSARVELRRARQARNLPATTAAVADATLSLDHLDLFGRANTTERRDALRAAEAELVAKCAELRFPKAVEEIGYWCQDADARRRDDKGPPDPPEERSTLYASATLGGRVVVNGDLGAIDGEIFTNELHRLEQLERLADQRASVERTPAQRRAAALVEMATRSGTAPPNGRRPTPLFTVLVGEGSLARLCELANGTILAPGLLMPWLGVADLESILFDGPQTILSVSHHRTFRGAVRRAVQVRDRHCQHPAGCDIRADRCDVDHIVSYVQHPVTGQHTGRIKCGPHNRHQHLHDDVAELPLAPGGHVDYLETCRARIRWRLQHEPPDPGDTS